MNKTKSAEVTPNSAQHLSFWLRVLRDVKINKWVYIMAIPVLAFYIIFCYWPMYGSLMAFQDYRPGLGVLGSEWVGFKHFISFFNSPLAFQLIRNTFLLSFYSLLFGFPAPLHIPQIVPRTGLHPRCINGNATLPSGKILSHGCQRKYKASSIERC